jgi:mannose-6-phosphate isomerase
MAYYVNRLRPFQLIPDFKDRIWGVAGLADWFPEAPATTVGEAWFTATENRTEEGVTFSELLKANPWLLGTGGDKSQPELCPLLVKFLFTSSRLSVQVHPEDEYARRHHQSLGKTEAWFVVDAQPGAEVALGFRENISPERLRDSAVSGEIEELLDWRRVSAGDVVFVPAGTVHAIGAGLTICEIQQNSDITYRLYDYGRPRELHLEHGCNVSSLGPYLHHFTRRELGAGRLAVAECDYFRIEHLTQTGSALELSEGLPHYCLLISLRGEGKIDGKAFRRGQVWVVPAESEAVKMESDNAEWLMTYPGTEPPPKMYSR